MPKPDAALHATRNSLSPQARAEMVPLLNARLADALDLQSQAKQAHWNVKGPNFEGLHALFDRVAAAAGAWADDLAERAVQMGGAAHGTVRLSAAQSSLKEYPLAARAGADHVAALTGALADFARAIRQSIEEATDALDAGTADLFTQVSRDADKLLWMVEAHGQ